MITPAEYWRYVTPTSQNDYGLFNFAYWLIAKLKKNKEAMADTTLCHLLNESRKVLKNLLLLMESNYGQKGHTDGFNDRDYAMLKQSLTQLISIIPIDKINQVLNTNKKTKEETEEGFFDYQQRLEDSDDSLDDYETSYRYVSIACKNTNAKGDYRSKFELDHLVKVIRHYMVTYRITFEQLVDVTALQSNSNFASELKKCLHLDENDKTLDEILNHLRKIDLIQYPSKNEQTDRTLASTKAEFLKDMMLLEKEVCTYKLKEKSVYLPSILVKNFEKALKSRSKTISYLNNAVVTTKVVYSYRAILKNFQSVLFHNNSLTSNYLRWIMCFKEKVMMYEQREDVVNFIKHLELVFIKSNKRADMVRLMNAILEKSKPTADFEDDDNPDLKSYRWLQNLLKDSEVTTLTLSLIHSGSDMQDIIDACKLLSNMLKFGNHSVQVFIYNTLQKGFFTKDFFYYLRFQFTNGLQSNLKGSKYPESRLQRGQTDFLGRDAGFDIRSYCETLNYILRMLKLLCDNCYLDFQNFLRVQQIAGLNDNSTSVDIVTTVADFITVVYKLHNELRDGSTDELLKAVTNTLTEFVLGPCRENQRILIENKKAIETLNSILNIDLSLTLVNSYDESLYFKVTLLNEIAIFIESLIVGNEDLYSLDSLLDSLNKDGLVNKLIEIYISKVKGRKSELILDQFCYKVFEEDHADGGDEQEDYIKEGRPEKITRCTYYQCFEGYRTKVDKLLVETGFKIFLIIQQLEDKIGENPGIEGFRYRFVPHLSRNVEVENKLFSNPEAMLQINTGLHETTTTKGDLLGRRTTEKDQESKKGHQILMKEITFFGNNPSKIKTKDRKSPVEPIPTLQDTNLKNGLSQEERSKLQQDKINPEYLEHYKRVLFNEGRQFFMSYVASVEVLHKDELIKIHFTIPYFCKYITEKIKNSIIWNTDRSSDQERLEMFLSKFDKYEYQMKRRQAISSRKCLYFFIDSWRLIRFLAYLVVVLINLVLLVSVTHQYTTEKNAESYLVYTLTTIYNNFSIMIKSNFITPLIVLEVFQLLFCLVNFLLVMLETAPEIIFNSYLLKRIEAFKKSQQLRFANSSKAGSDLTNFNPHSISFLRKGVLVMKSFTNQYNLLLIILSAIALSGYKALYALLLFDIVTHSQNLRSTVVNFIRNYKIIVMSGVILILLVYFLSIIGFEYFPYIFNRVGFAYLGSH